MTKPEVIILSIIGFLFCQVNAINRYNDYTLIKMTPYNHQQLKALVNVSYSEGVDIMKHSHGLNDTTDILVSPQKRKQIETFAKLRGMGIHRVNHYGRYFDNEVALIRKNDHYEPLKYNSYQAMSNRLITLSKENRRYVQLEKLGKSYEGRKMSLIKISANHKARNPVIFLDAGAHAREWAAPAMAMYIIEQLAIAAKKPLYEADELHGLDWYILPLVNPDGYEYTRIRPDNRMWRKTRSKTWREGCFGADINRNYDFMWGYSGSSFDPCSFQIFAGTEPFSESETKLVRNVMKKYSKRIKLYVSIHTYGHYLIYPWGFTGSYLPDGWEKLDRLAKLYSNAVVRAGGEPLYIMSSGQWYPTSGGSCDYAFKVAKIPYSFTLEITAEEHGFILAEYLLPQVLPQYYEGLKVIAKEIKSEFTNRG